MQIAMHTIRKRFKALVFALAATGMVVANVTSVAAADLTAASLELSDPRPDETSVTYTFSAASFSADTLECVAIQFNDAADMGGAAPAGLDASSAAIDAASTAVTAGSWTDNSATAQLEIIDGTEAASDGTLVFTGVTNGSTDGTTYFAQLRTYTVNDCATGLVDTVTVAFVYIDGELVQLTIEPTLTFTCTGLPVLTDVNGTSTTLNADCTGTDFDNNVTSSTNGVVGHNLNVTTNAATGYTVYIRHTALLTNESSDTITNHTGTNAAPTAFPAAGTEAWGYTTEDNSLAGGTANRFTSAGGFSGFTTGNEEIMDGATTSGTGDDVEVAYQVGVAADTEAGTYQNTVIYTVVATY